MSQEKTLPFRSRLAPTPSGFLHLGNLASFALTWLVTRFHHGQLLLRIDDLDNDRFRQEYLEDIFATLDYTGIDYDEGPGGPGDLAARWSQHFRLPAYNQLLERLNMNGSIYGCTCSRKSVRASSKTGVYPGTCRHKQLPLDAADIAWRIFIPDNTTILIQDAWSGTIQVQADKEIGDFVVRGKNQLPAYQIASLADDLHFAINYAVRGNDLLHSTASQLFLAQTSGDDSFQQMRWLHHPLLHNALGEKLSKSAGALSIQYMRQQGASRKKLVQSIADVWWPDHQKKSTIETMADLLDFFASNPIQPGSL